MTEAAKNPEKDAIEYLRKIYGKGPASAPATLERFAKFMAQADDMVEIVLKGHLLIEEALTRITTKYVIHGDYLQKADLTFWQKVHVARSMSLDESQNTMWELVLGYNRVRNDYGHSLEPKKAPDHIRGLREAYVQERGEHGDVSEAKKLPDDRVMKDIAVYVLGFLGSFEDEVDRYKEWMAKLDRIVNPHRHTKPTE